MSGPQRDLRRLFHFWLPLALTWQMMAVEQPLLAAVIARLPQVREQLAAFGLAYALALVGEAPVIMLMSASTALVSDAYSYQKVRRFLILILVSVSLFMGVLALPGVFFPVFRLVFGLPDTVLTPAHQALVWLLPWAAAIGFRRFYQGIMIRQGQTKSIALATITRILTLSATVFFLSWRGLPGALCGGAALSAGVVAEALFTRLAARRAVGEILATGEAPGVERSHLGLRGLLHFYVPLALTSFLALAVHPLVSFVLARSNRALDSLAVMPVINGAVFIFRSLGLSYQEVVIAWMGQGRQYYPLLRRGAWMLAFLAGGGILLLAATPLARLWLEGVSGLDPELSAFARWPLLVLAGIPALSVWQSFQRGLLVHVRRTPAISWATALEVGGIAVFLTLAFALHWPGALGAALAYLGGRILANLYLWRAQNRARAQWEAMEVAHDA